MSTRKGETPLGVVATILVLWIVGVLLSLTLTATVIWAIVQVVGALT